MPRFTLKELFAGMGLIALGLSMVSLSGSSIFPESGLAAGIPLGLWYAGGMLVGVGAMVPFNKVLAGAWIGLFVFSLLDLVR
jgi:hypothetical protein